jgi:hypothetical protein
MRYDFDKQFTLKKRKTKTSKNSTKKNKEKPKYDATDELIKRRNKKQSTFQVKKQK